MVCVGLPDETPQALRARIAAGRGGALARVALVCALLTAGDTSGALAEARAANDLFTDLAPVVAVLGEALLAAGHLPTAIAELQRALRLDSGNAAVRRLLAEAWLAAGEADQALAVSDDAALVARAQAIKAAPRSDAGYVRHLFDQFSADYDQRMRQHLRYAAPEILLGLFGLVMPGRDGLRILDLGCGTGLAGEVFRPLAARLDGIDLSPAMIAKAGGRGIYDDLAVADLEGALAEAGPSYDLILAADTLVYLGDLAPVFRGVARRLSPDGIFLFTVEQGQEGFTLGPKRRWRHGETYLRGCAAEAGLSVAGLMEAAPRQENNQPVAGFAVALRRS